MTNGLGWKAPSIKAPEGSSLYSEEREEKQRGRDVSRIQRRMGTAQRRRERYKIKGTPDSPLVTPRLGELVRPYNFAGDFRENAGLNISPLIRPSVENRDSVPRNVMNFLFGEDMAIWGMQWDKEGFDWNFQNMKDQWSEEPLWSTVTLGFQALTLVAPYARAIKLGSFGQRLGGRGAGRSMFGMKPGFKYYPQIGATKGHELAEEIASHLPGSRTLGALDEARPWFSAPEFMSMSERGARRFEIDMLRDFDVVDNEFIFRRYGDDEIRRLVDQHGDKVHLHLSDFQLEKVYSEIPTRQMARMRRQVQKYNTANRLAAKALLAKEKGQDISLTAGEEIVLGFNRLFGNSYFKKTMGLTPDEQMRSDIANALNRWNPPGNLGQIASDPPTVQMMKLFFHKWIKQYAIRDGAGHTIPDPPSIPAEWQAKLDLIENTSRNLQQEGLTSGWLSEGEVAKNPFHISFVRRQHKVQHGELDKLVRSHVVNIKDPKTGEVGEQLMLSTTIFPRLSDPALLPRRQPWNEVYEAMERGELFDDPADFYLHTMVNDHLLLENYKAVRDVLMDRRYIASAAEMDAKYTSKKIPVPPEWINLDTLVTGMPKSRLMRMIRKKAGNDTEELSYLLGSLDKTQQQLPYMRAGVADALFGKEGMFAQSQQAAGWLEALTTIYKSMRTGLNIPTHLQNTLGNTVFLAQAGMNPLSRKTWRLARDLSKNFAGYTAAKRDGTELAWVAKNREVMVEYNGFKMPFVDLVGFGANADRNRKAQDLLIESAFEYVEAWTHLERVYNRVSSDHGALKSFVGKILAIHDPSKHKRSLTTIEGQILNLSKKGLPIEEIARRVGMSHNLKGVKESLDIAEAHEMSLMARKYRSWVTDNFSRMTAAYLAEDIIPKFMLVMKGMSEGMTFNSSITEVGRRLPMYNTVGSFFKTHRRVALPWVTFPSEAVRITKNNMMDDPLRLIPWLRAPQILQSTAYSLGMTGDDETFESLEAAKRGIPLWAQQGPETIMYGGKTGMAAGGALVTGTVGAFGGGIAGGPMGAIIGGLVGGISGAGASYYLDRDGEQIRGAVLNWLPHSSFMMSELRAPDFTFSRAKDVMDVLPAEPFAILKPLYEAWAGRDQYGNDMATGGFGDSIKKTIAGYVGFLSPPVIQKYGYRTATPDLALFGNEWTGGAITAAAAGVLAAGIQKKTGVPMMKGLSEVSKKSIAKAAAVGGMLGGTTNVSRIYTDSGLSKDPYGREGTSAQDFFFNNIGLMRSYRSTPEQRIANEGLHDRHIQEVRSFLGRQLRYYSENGDTENMMRVLKDIQVSFKAQYEEAALSQRRYSDFLEEYLSSIGQHPALRNLSKEEMVRRLRMASQNAENVRGLAEEEMRRMLIKYRAEQVTRAAVRRKR